ncbi:MobF family relaxase [Cellulomonas endophytica]|uniref:MobF family relaxase n=1 Tax=Cellulomonas endophytica TaxID=2494735 RepID=UPI001F0BFF65|nr:MobF family relaxase [Cellulomonas endophytica]
MTMHRLSAGAGYQYLLRHIATADGARTAGASLATYYLESGNPPGRWWGAGLASLGAAAGVAGAPRLTAGALVDEQGMERLFARGADPVTGWSMGRPFQQSLPLSDRVSLAAARLPAGMSVEARSTALESILHREQSRVMPHSVAGFDLSFTVLKSVATLWAVGDRDVQVAVLDAHRAAVEQAMTLLEDRVLLTRTGHGGCRQERTRGSVAAAFDHWDSRAGDPNLHTHVVLSNKVQGLDGAWRSVDSRALHHAVVTVSQVYDALLVDEVSRRLPVRWGWRGRGARRSPAFEIDGMEDGLLRVFSARSSQIDAAMTESVARFAAERGRLPDRVEVTRMRQVATRATRPPKKVLPLRELVQRWRERASQVTGASPEELTARAIHQSRVDAVTADGVGAEVIAQFAELVQEQVRTRRATWTRWNVLAEAARVSVPLTMRSPADRVVLLDRIADAVLVKCISVEAPAVLIAAGRSSRPEGGSVFDRPAEDRFTDMTILDAERSLLAAVTDTTAPTAAAAPAEACEGGSAELAPDQAAAVCVIASSARRLEVLVGPAGSGKTTTLLAVRRAWEAEYGPGSLIGLAPSASAAATLAGALGVACENTSKWIYESSGAGAHARAALSRRLRELDESADPVSEPEQARHLAWARRAVAEQDQAWRLRTGQLVVVDEASLAGTLTLAELTRQATAVGAKVLLVGDHAQLTAVDAGGAFGLLATRNAGPVLNSLWRFVHPWEAQATLGLREGNPRVLEVYDEHDRIRSGAPEAMLEAAYTAWAADTDAGRSTVLIAPDAKTVAALNQRAHNDRVTEGLVSQTRAVTTSDGVVIGVGDRVLTRQNDRRLRVTDERGHGFVRNGDLWDVIAATDDGAMTLRRVTAGADHADAAGAPSSQSGVTVVVPAAYVREHVDLGYAVTTHRAQGVTVARAHAVAHPGMTRENLYVALTRGRHANHVYVALEEVDADCDPPALHATQDAFAVLEAILATSGAERSATQTIADRLDYAESLARLRPIEQTLLADASAARWTEALTDAGMSEQQLGAVRLSPDVGRLFATLDRLATVNPDTATTVAGMMRELDCEQEDPVPALTAAAMHLLHRTGEDPRDIPTAPADAFLDQAGADMLGQVRNLISARTAAVTQAALAGSPPWVQQYGAEPTDLTDRQAWLGAISAEAAQRDERPNSSAYSWLTPQPAGPTVAGVGAR